MYILTWITRRKVVRCKIVVVLSMHRESGIVHLRSGTPSH